jgi:hypothetical protein
MSLEIGDVLKWGRSMIPHPARRHPATALIGHDCHA